MQEILSLFEEVSGLKINMAKLELFPVGEVSNMDELVALLGCRKYSLPMKYLGLPLGVTFKERTIWNLILEKLVSQRRLTG